MTYVLRNKRGVTLTELMITIVVFAIVLGMIYSVNNSFLRFAASERKSAKTELDSVNVSWPLVKEIGSAGFGIPSGGDCTPAISFTGGELTVHSTSAGDSQYAGKWSFVSGTTCDLTGLPNSSQIVLVNTLDRSQVATSTVSSTSKVTDCVSNYAGHIAYWSPYATAGDLQCYRIKYKLDSSTAAPVSCAAGTLSLQRSAAKSPTNNFGPMLDCVRAMDFRFGCIDPAGDLLWRTDQNCGVSSLRLLKVGLIIQDSTRRDEQVPENIELFKDLGTGLQNTITLTEAQRFYKWRKIEQTVILKNLE